MKKLPAEKVNSLILSYLFKGFIWTFSDFFRIEKDFKLTATVGKKNFFTWNDDEYRDFMIYVISNLEPFEELKHTILANELYEFNEILFVNKGKVVIGYEINKQKRYCLQFTNKCVVGAFGLTFNQRSKFIYTSLTKISGYFIRQNHWMGVLEDYPMIGNRIKRNVIWEYLCKINVKVNINKRKILKSFE